MPPTKLLAKLASKYKMISLYLENLSCTECMHISQGHPLLPHEPKNLYRLQYPFSAQLNLMSCLVRYFPSSLAGQFINGKFLNLIFLWLWWLSQWPLWPYSSETYSMTFRYLSSGRYFLSPSTEKLLQCFLLFWRWSSISSMAAPPLTHSLQLGHHGSPSLLSRSFSCQQPPPQPLLPSDSTLELRLIVDVHLCRGSAAVAIALHYQRRLLTAFAQAPRHQRCCDALSLSLFLPRRCCCCSSFRHLLYHHSVFPTIVRPRVRLFFKL